jgi:hypothetical protein
MFCRAPRGRADEREQEESVFALAARGARGEEPHLSEREVSNLL